MEKYERENPGFNQRSCWFKPVRRLERIHLEVGKPSVGVVGPEYPYTVAALFDQYIAVAWARLVAWEGCTVVDHKLVVGEHPVVPELACRQRSQFQIQIVPIHLYCHEYGRLWWQ